MATTEYGFETSGIGNIIKKDLFKVPPNQRPYAWKKEHVGELLEDIKEAMNDKGEIYFLGTVVLVDSESGRKLIADGQQRLATITIILARCRDLLRELGETNDADAIEKEFLRRYIRKSKDFEFLLTMNIEDDVYFKDIILDKNWAKTEPEQPSSIYPSNERLFAASKAALAYLRQEVSPLSPKLAAEALNRWTNFLEERASVVAVTVPDEVGAYRMFETLNDRGLRASQADILKNYFFSRVNPGDLDQVQAQWNQMYGALADKFDDADEQMIKYIKYFWTLDNGLTRDRELAANIKKKIKKPKQAVDFVTQANSAVSDYVAIFNAQDTKWVPYGQGVRDDLATLTTVIGIEQIVPLVFAVANFFEVAEARKAFKLFVAWSVRFILGGTGRAGRLDKQYAELANDVGIGKIKSAKELRERLKDKVPTDDAFRRAVTDAKVSSSVLARYYLISLEKAFGEGSGELEPSRDVAKVNLEHVIPKTFTTALGMTKAEQHDLVTRLGNQTIMLSEWNRDLGNLPFDEKVITYAKSELSLTNKLALLGSFHRAEIDARQSAMAEMAPKIWSTKFGA